MLSRLEQAIGHTFGDAAQLKTALTHRSYSAAHNERLEFIGDAILNAAIARLLFERFPQLPEGDLSRLRANLVCQDSLHRLAQAIDLGRHLRLGDGELKSGGSTRPSILADALEAVFGAIWMDAGFEAADVVIRRLYAPLMQSDWAGKPIKDAKTRLQEYLQGRHLPLPRYESVAVEGDAHAQRFHMACLIESLGIRTAGEGGSRRAAEQVAAERALEQIGLP